MMIMEAYLMALVPNSSQVQYRVCIMSCRGPVSGHIRAGASSLPRIGAARIHTDLRVCMTVKLPRTARKLMDPVHEWTAQ